MGFFDPRYWDDLLEDWEQIDENEFDDIKSISDYFIYKHDNSSKKIYWRRKVEREKYRSNISINDSVSYFETLLSLLKSEHPNFYKRKELNNEHILVAGPDVQRRYNENREKYFTQLGLEFVNKPYIKINRDRENEVRPSFHPNVVIYDAELFIKNKWILLAGNNLGEVSVVNIKPKFLCDSLLKYDGDLACLHPQYWNGFLDGEFDMTTTKGAKILKKYLINPIRKNKQKIAILIPSTFIEKIGLINNDSTFDDIIENLELSLDIVDGVDFFL